MANRTNAIYDDVTEYINEQGRTYKEVYSDNVYEFVVKLVTAVDEGKYQADFFEYGDYLSWFDETIRDDYEELDALPHGDVINIRDLTGSYIKYSYLPDMFIEPDEDYDPGEDWDEDLEDVMY